MRGGPWDIVVHGTAVDRATRAAQPVEIAWRSGEDCVVVLAASGREMTMGDDRGIYLDVARVFLFPPDGGPAGGESAEATVRDPVNLDGSPRNRLRDRLARSGSGSEAMAAD